MAEKRVSELTAATEVLDSDLFVMEQGGVAKRVTAAILKALFGTASDDNNDSEEETASNGLPAGGTAGQMLVKKSEADYDAEWQDAPEAPEEEVEVSAINFSNWDSGSFTITMADGTTKSGTVAFDSDNNPKSITLNGHTMTITLPA